MANYDDDFNQNNTQFSEFGTNDSMNYSYPGQGNSGAYSGNAYSSMDSAEVSTNVIAKAFMIMVIALVVTAISAVVTLENTALFTAMINNMMIFFVAELAVVFAASFAIQKNKAVLAGALFTAYCIINGITLSVIFYAYEIGSIQQIFLLAAAVFAVMAIYGFTTKRNLTSIGSIGIMALFGMIVVTLLNALIFHSSGIDMLMNYVGVLIFVGLTAYDIQKLKNHSLKANPSDANSLAIFFAMELYLDLINLFLRLLAIFGRGRD